MSFDDIRIVGVDAYYVVRDDCFRGGTKARVLQMVNEQMPQNGIVYAAHPYGYGALALATWAEKISKPLVLIYPPYPGYPDPKAMQR